MYLRFVAASALFLLPASAFAGLCDGTEVVCAPLTHRSDAEATGGTVVGGGFGADGFRPSDRGGIDWVLPPGTPITAGRLEVDVTGLQPLDAPELGGGKVSLFSLCGEDADDNEYIGMQKMPPDYRDGHIFRYGMDDDGLADNWDAVVITGANFGCPFTIQSWTAGQTHHIAADWSPDGLRLQIDGTVCTSGGNGDAFDPRIARLVLGNRCEHHSNQQPLAGLANLRVWATGEVPDGGDEPDDTGVPDGCAARPITAPGLSPTAASGSSEVFTAIYDHCEGADQFRVVQLMVADEVVAGAPWVYVGFSEGRFGLAGEQCLAGEPRVLQGEYGGLDCEHSAVRYDGTQLVVDYALVFDTDTFPGTHGVFFDAKGGLGDPEPRLGWTRLGTFTVTADAMDADDPDEPEVLRDGPAGCGCLHAGGGASLAFVPLLLLVPWKRR